MITATQSAERTISVRPATIADYGKVWALHALFTAESGTAEGFDELRMVQEQHRVLGWFAQPDRHNVWLACYGEEPIGYIQLRSSNYVGANPYGIVCEGLFVKRQHRGGRAIVKLYRAALEKVQAMGRVDVQIAVPAALQRQHRVVAKWGFTPRHVIYQLEFGNG